MSTQPLQGVRILDLTRVLAGPFCTMVLADLGGDVVKVERPDGGDDARQFGPFLSSGESAYFASLNRGKKSITLNLKDRGDHEQFLKLVNQADVLVENYRPGTMEHLGLSSGSLRKRNPRLIYASATGFGRTGPDAARAAYDVIVQARSGLMSLTGHDAAAPARVGSSISDILAGLYTAISVTTALYERTRTGSGCDLDLSMLECSVSVLENAIARFAVTGIVPGPLGTRHPSIAPFQAFQAADGLLVIGAGNDILWRRLCEAIEALELVADPKLATNQDRCSHCTYLELQLNQRLARHTVTEWLVRLDAAGVPASAIKNLAEVVTDPQLEARGMWHTLQDSDQRSLISAGTPFMIDGQKPHLSSAWPRLGEHNERVRRDWLGEEA